LPVPEGSNAVFTIRLAAQPSANVVVTVTRVSGDSNIVVQSGATNVFTPQNWSVPLPVTLAATKDSDQVNGTATLECRSDGLAPVTIIATEEDTTPNSVLVVTINNPSWGGVSPTAGSYPPGTSVEVTATPSSYFRFVQWTGNYVVTNNPLVVVLDTNVTIQALFAEIATTNHATPYWWLASNGYTQNFETAELLLGANKLPLWQSYVAGLSPNDPESQSSHPGRARQRWTIPCAAMEYSDWPSLHRAAKHKSDGRLCSIGLGLESSCERSDLHQCHGPEVFAVVISAPGAEAVKV
jgi:hypothetical protein